MSKKRWGQGNIYLRGETYWIHYSVKGKTVRESAKTKKESVALTTLRRRLHAVETGEYATDMQRVTVGELLDDLRTDYIRHQKSVDWCNIVIKHLLPQFQYLKATTVGTAEVEKYIRAREETVSGATINRELALLRRAFNLGTRTIPPKVSPAQRLPVPKLKESAPRKGFFISETLASLIAELPEEIGVMATFAYSSGCRKSEVFKMQWDWVDLKWGVIELPGEITKNREARNIPLTGELAAMFADLKKKRDELWPNCPWVFSRAGRPIKNIYCIWKSACLRANLPENTRLFHDLRRSGVRNLIRAKVSKSVAKKISGHKTDSVFDRYNITDTTDIVDAMKLLDTFTIEEAAKAAGAGK